MIINVLYRKIYFMEKEKLKPCRSLELARLFCDGFGILSIFLSVYAQNALSLKKIIDHPYSMVGEE